MELKSKVIFADTSLKNTFDRLDNLQETAIKKALEKAFSQLEKDAFSGIQLPKRLIPRTYGSIDNLWNYDLPRGWRLLYTIKRDEIHILSIVLEWMSHKDYERRFRYAF